MNDFSDNLAIITGYISKGNIYLLTEQEYATLKMYNVSNCTNGQTISVEHLFELLRFKNYILPLTEFYKHFDEQKEKNVFTNPIVNIIISNNKNYLISINKFLTPLVPGFYLLYQEEATYEYSLKCVNGKLTIVIVPTQKDSTILRLVNRLALI